MDRDDAFGFRHPASVHCFGSLRRTMPRKIVHIET